MAKNKKSLSEFMDEDDAEIETSSGNQNDTNNEVNVIRQKMMAIVSSLEIIEDEKEMIKGLCKDLKDHHGITSKIAKKVAKILANPDLLEEFEAENNTIENLYLRVKK